MALEFDKNGNLSKDLILSCNEFKQLFGYNKEREKQIYNLFIVASKLKKIGCNSMLVFGSFATQEDFPNDIDVCFDISHLDKKILEKNYSLLDNYERRRFREYLLVHVILKETADKNIVKWMNRDRDGSERGIIEVNLKDLQDYDKE